MSPDRTNGYAQGIFEMARAEGHLERVEDELLSVARAVETAPELRSNLDELLPSLRVEPVASHCARRRT